MNENLVLKVTTAALELLARGVQMGVELGGTLGSEAATARTLFERRVAGLGRCSCDIPPPCWMPVSLGEVFSYVGRCDGEAILQLHIHNCSLQQTTVTANVQGANAQVNPAALTLAPLDSGTITLTFKVGKDAKAASKARVVVRGCKTHYLDWTIIAGPLGTNSTHQIKIEDCMDYRHHWYDHFYCARPCIHGRGLADGHQSHG